MGGLCCERGGILPLTFSAFCGVKPVLRCIKSAQVLLVIFHDVNAMFIYCFSCERYRRFSVHTRVALAKCTVAVREDALNG